MTDAELSEAVARALGWEKSSHDGGWHRPNECISRGLIPYSSPEQIKAMLDWAVEQRKDFRFVLVIGGKIWRAFFDRTYADHPKWERALALAFVAAQEKSDD